MASLNKAYSTFSVKPTVVIEKEELTDSDLEQRYNEMVERKAKAEQFAKEKSETESRLLRITEGKLESLRKSIKSFRVLTKLGPEDQERLFQVFSGEWCADIKSVGDTELSKKLRPNHFLDFHNYAKIYDWSHENASKVSAKLVYGVPDFSNSEWENDNDKVPHDARASLESVSVKGSFYGKLSNERYARVEYGASLDMETLEWTASVHITYSEDIWGLITTVSDNKDEQLKFAERHKSVRWFS